MFSKNKQVIESYLSELFSQNPILKCPQIVETLPNDLKTQILNLVGIELISSDNNDTTKQVTKEESILNNIETNKLRLSDFKRLLEVTDENEKDTNRNRTHLDELIDWAEENFNDNVRSNIMCLLNPLFDHRMCLGHKTNCKLERVEDVRYLESIHRSRFDIDENKLSLTSSTEKLHMSELNKKKRTKTKKETKSICKKLKKQQQQLEIKSQEEKEKRNKKKTTKELSKNETSDSVRNFIDFFRKRKNDRFPYSFPRY